MRDETRPRLDLARRDRDCKNKKCSLPDLINNEVNEKFSLK